MAFINSGPSGFQNAPLSKLILMAILFINISSHLFLPTPVGTTTCSSFASLSCHRFTDLIKSPGLWWKFPISVFFFNTFHDLFLITISLYVFRIFERIWGTFKLLLFFTLCITSSSVIQFSTAFFSEILFNIRFGWTSPLISYIFALWVCYIAEVPALHSVSLTINLLFKRFTISMTEKSLIHAIIVQMFIVGLYNWNFSHVWLQICGFLLGCFWQLDFARIESKGTDLLFSPKFRVFLTRYILSMFNSSQNVTAEERWAQQQRMMMERAQLLGVGAARRNNANAQPRNVQGRSVENLLGNNQSDSVSNLLRTMLAFQDLQQGGQIRQRNNQNPISNERELNDVNINHENNSEDENNDFSSEDDGEIPTNNSNANPDSVVPDPVLIAKIEEMGIGTRIEIENALRLTHNSAERSIELLLAQNS